MVDAGILGPKDRTELIDGHLLEMAPQNAPHRAVIVEDTKLFVDALRDTVYSVQVQSTLPLDCRNVPEPEYTVFRGSGEDLLTGEADEIPLIGKVSDPTLPTDRTDKLRCYASNAIPEYGIVNLRNETIEVYRDPADEEYRQRLTKTKGEPIEALFSETVSFEVDVLLPTVSSDHDRRPYCSLVGAWVVFARRSMAFSRAFRTLRLKPSNVARFTGLASKRRSNSSRFISAQSSSSVSVTPSRGR